MSYRAAIAMSLALLFVPIASGAQGIHRCIGGDGQINFTDRPCDDLQMQEREPRPEAPVSIGGVAAASRSCARNRDDLLADVRNALELHDVNRLAASYLWKGMGTREAYARMDRFRIVSARPLIDAQLVATESIAAPLPESSLPESSPSESSPTDELADHIRIDQLHSAKNSEPETSYYRIVAAAGCVWIRD